MKPFDFCPSCATKLEDVEDGAGKGCPNCGRKWYPNSAPTVGAAIVRDGEALITKRGRAPEKGKFDIPGGFLEAGEDALVGLRRELKEELGIEVDVSIDDVVQMETHTYGEEGGYVLAIGFFARLASGEPSPSDDVADIKWVTLDELDEVDFAWEHDRELVRKALLAAGGGHG